MLDPETPQQTLPSVVPYANLVISSLATVAILFITVRRWRLDRYVSRLFVVDLMSVVMCVVLLAGAAFQSGLIGADPWTLVGTGGRVIVLAGFAALLLQRWEHIPVLDSALPSHEKILRLAREEAAELLKDAARVAAEKVRLEAIEVAELRHDVRRTADNTERIAEAHDRQERNGDT